MQNAVPKRQAKFDFFTISEVVKPKFFDNLLFSTKVFLIKT